MSRFIHLSDLHIHGAKYKNENCAKVVGEVVSRYSAANPRPVVLLTGDIVDDGTEKQYENAVALLKPLVDNGFTVMACPGNHDYGPKGNIYSEAAQDRFREYILDKLLGISGAAIPDTKMEELFPWVRIADRTRFIAVDSVVGNEDQPLHLASGDMGKKQRDKLAGLLGGTGITNPQYDRTVVFFHHHPFYRMFGLQMDHAREVMEILSGEVDVLCFGHKHQQDLWMHKSDIKWILAAGQSTEPTENGIFRFREVNHTDAGYILKMVVFQ